VLAFDGNDPAHLAAYAGGWLSLSALRLTFAAVRRRLARGHRLPLSAPADLDPYGLAVLAGGADRLRDAALAALAVRGDLPLVGPKPLDYLPVAPPRARLSAPVGLPTVAPTNVVAERPAGGGPAQVEAAMLQAVDAGGVQKWVASAAEAARRLADGYGPELQRLDLLPRPAGNWAEVAGVVCGVLLVAYDILGIIAAAESPHPDPKALEPSVVMFFACGLALVVALGLVVGPLHLPDRNRRGERVLAEAQENYADLIPRGRPWQRLSSDELALSVALFGLKGWATLPPLSQLYEALYPPPPPEPSSPV
jgi:uncharacterized protein (TIGR04222 family)